MSNRQNYRHIIAISLNECHERHSASSYSTPSTDRGSIPTTDNRILIYLDIRAPINQPELLDEHGYAQHVTEPTRHSTNGKTANLLDIVITAASRTPPLVSSVEVHSSHQLSDHSVVICEL